MKPVLVGELNPYGRDPRYALYPEPAGSAGGRLQRLVLGLSKKEYLSRFDRVNLCAGRWSKVRAEERADAVLAVVKARQIVSLEQSDAVIVLLGAKVAAAFSSWVPLQKPFTYHRTCYHALCEARHCDGPNITFVYLPHPSGRCRAWNDAGAFERAREVLREVGALHKELKPAPGDDRLRRELLEDGTLTCWTTSRPALCSNCHRLVRGCDCPDCGPQ